MKRFIARLGIVGLGLILMGSGLAVMIATGLGVSPWTTFSIGLSRVLPFTVGQAFRLVNLALFIIVIFLDHKRLGLGTILTVGILGEFIDFFSRAIRVLALNELVFTLKIPVFTAGLLLLAFGIGVYVSVKLGAGPVEALMLSLTYRFNWKLSLVRICMDATALGIGLLLGAPVGIGTVMCVAGIGPIVAKTLGILTPLCARLIPENAAARPETDSISGTAAQP